MVAQAEVLVVSKDGIVVVVLKSIMGLEICQRSEWFERVVLLVLGLKQSIQFHVEYVLSYSQCRWKYPRSRWVRKKFMDRDT